MNLNLIDAVVHVYDHDKFWDDIKAEWAKLKFDMSTGKKPDTISHGDYGYVIINGVKKERLFLKTHRQRVEPFCMQPRHEKCCMNTDANKNKDHYFICGNLFKMVAV